MQTTGAEAKVHGKFSPLPLKKIRRGPTSRARVLCPSLGDKWLHHYIWIWDSLMLFRNRLASSATATTRAGGWIACAFAVLALAVPAQAQYNQRIGNDMAKCAAGAGPAVRVTINDIKSSSGNIRVQLYRATKADWLASGRWLNRMELPARAGSMTVCVPAPGPGTYGIAVRHDANGNGKTDLTKDGGGMSNNPSINIFNLGKPSHTRVAFELGDTVKPMTIRMRYM